MKNLKVIFLTLLLFGLSYSCSTSRIGANYKETIKKDAVTVKPKAKSVITNPTTVYLDRLKTDTIYKDNTKAIKDYLDFYNERNEHKYNLLMGSYNGLSRKMDSLANKNYNLGMQNYNLNQDNISLLNKALTSNQLLLIEKQIREKVEKEKRSSDVIDKTRDNYVSYIIFGGIGTNLVLFLGLYLMWFYNMKKFKSPSYA